MDQASEPEVRTRPVSPRRPEDTPSPDEGLQLLQAFHAIRSPARRLHILELVFAETREEADRAE